MSAVLIVDDEANIRGLLERFIADMGHEIRTAPDAESAVQMLAHWTPDVVLCDIKMPGANGLWLADQIRDAAPATAIVLATGEATVPPHESLRRGVVAYVLKPFKREQVRRAVEEGIRWSAAAARTQPRSRTPRRLPGGSE